MSPGLIMVSYLTTAICPFTRMLEIKDITEQEVSLSSVKLKSENRLIYYSFCIRPANSILDLLHILLYGPFSSSDELVEGHIFKKMSYLLVVANFCNHVK